MSNYINNIFPINILDADFLYHKTKGITSIYGWRVPHPVTGENKFHRGIDLGGRRSSGAPIYAPYSGTLKTFFDDRGGGNVAEIVHDDNFKTRYMHLQSFNKTGSGVKDKDEIKQGEIIGFVGTTGESTGPHLHFEVWEYGKHVDPAPYIYGYTFKIDKNKNYVKDELRFSKSGQTAPDRSELKSAPISLNDTQIENHQKIIDYCKKNNVSKHDTICAILALYVESSSGTVLVGNHKDQITIKGPFQQTANWGPESERLDLIGGLKLFLNGGRENGTHGLSYFKNRENNSHAHSVEQVQGADGNGKIVNPKYFSPHENTAIKIYNILSNDYDVGGYEDETEIDEEDVVEKVDIRDKVAPGIWQIVKVIIDPEVKDFQINDTTISMQQGSLYSFFEKICQKPFVEFFGDTYGDQYYFIIRKPPFTRQSFNSLPTYFISENEVYNDSLKWNDEQVYSWYQLIPNGNYIGANAKIWQYLKAVFFEEYAEIWGSRPLSITSNYITFQKSNGELVEQQAILDLKFIIDIHSYLPFTRKGSITLKGDRRLKRGMRIYYEPTNEYFYIDSVQQSFSANNGFLDRTTIVQVSHGMVKENCEVEIDDNKTKSYFNLINYGENLYKSLNEKQEATEVDFDKHIPELVALFNIDRDSFVEEDIDTGINEWYLNNENESSYNLNIQESEEIKITRSIYNQNFERCKEIASFLLKYQSIKINLIGTTDSNATSQYNIDLGKRRANTIKNIIVEKYRELLNYHGSQELIDKEIETLKNRINCITLGEEKPKHNNSVPIGRLFNRSVICRIDKPTKKETEKKEQEEKSIKNPDNGKWHVNREVFTYFLRREQFY